MENPMDGGAWWAAVHGVAEGRTRLSDFTFTVHFHALEKAMATLSGVLAWRIPGTGEPGGLPSMESQSRTRLKRLSIHICFLYASNVQLGSVIFQMIFITTAIKFTKCQEINLAEPPRSLQRKLQNFIKRY